MQRRYRIAWDFSGWAVIDTHAGRLAEVDGLPLLALAAEDAEHAARTLNDLHNVAERPLPVSVFSREKRRTD